MVKFELNIREILGWRATDSANNTALGDAWLCFKYCNEDYLCSFAILELFLVNLGNDFLLFGFKSYKFSVFAKKIGLWVFYCTRCYFQTAGAEVCISHYDEVCVLRKLLLCSTYNQRKKCVAKNIKIFIFGSNFVRKSCQK